MKLGQPEPLSYLLSLVKSSWPQAAQWYSPGALLALSGPVKARSVPCSRST